MEQNLTLLQYCAILGVSQANGSKSRAFRIASDKYRAKSHRHLSTDDTENLRHLIEEWIDRTSARSYLIGRAS